MNWQPKPRDRAYTAMHDNKSYRVRAHGKRWTALRIKFTKGAPHATLPEYLGTYPTASEAKAACERHAGVA